MDTGADINLVSVTWVAKHPQLRKRQSTLKISGAFGPPLRNPQLVDIPLKVRREGKTTLITFAVAPMDGGADLILSSNAIRALGLALPDPAKEVRVRSERKPVGREVR